MEIIIIDIKKSSRIVTFICLAFFVFIAVAENKYYVVNRLP